MLPVPDDKRLFLLLRETELYEEQAYTFVQELRTMAAENYISRFESKLDAQREILESQAKMLSARINMLMWALGVASSLLVALKFLPVQ